METGYDPEEMALVEDAWAKLSIKEFKARGGLSMGEELLLGAYAQALDLWDESRMFWSVYNDKRRSDKVGK